MHIRRKYRTPNAIEIQEFNSARCPGGHKPRRQKENPTSERVARNNQRRKQREAGRMVDAYFNPDDLVLTLTYRTETRPDDVEGALKHFSKLTSYLRREYGKRYYELFWMRNVEIGPKGGTHIHMIVNRIEGAEFLIKDYWRQYGGVYVQYLQDMHDQQKDIGEYIAKSPVTCDRVVKTSWGHSRNIKKVPPEDKVITGRKMTAEPQVPRGWYLDKSTMYEGTTADGYPFRTYTLRRIQRRQIDHKMKPAAIRKLQKAGKKGKRKCSRKKSTGS